MGPVGSGALLGCSSGCVKFDVFYDLDIEIFYGISVENECKFFRNVFIGCSPCS